MLRKLLEDFAFSIPYEDMDRDIDNIREAILRNLALFHLNEDDTEFQVLEHHFFRNKGAYIVGRILAGGRSMPIVLPILHNEAGGVYVDTILFGSDMVSAVQLSTRSYFLVDAHTGAERIIPAATDAGQAHFRDLQRHRPQ
ncbi:MAG: isocitrate dehydrogenase kinase/phosphatase AceK regulatory subunit [Halioglobus sp.]